MNFVNGTEAALVRQESEYGLMLKTTDIGLIFRKNDVLLHLK
jgi:hypothetical protein